MASSKSRESSPSIVTINSFLKSDLSSKSFSLTLWGISKTSWFTSSGNSIGASFSKITLLISINGAFFCPSMFVIFTKQIVLSKDNIWAWTISLTLAEPSLMTNLIFPHARALTSRSKFCSSLITSPTISLYLRLITWITLNKPFM